MYVLARKVSRSEHILSVTRMNHPSEEQKYEELEKLNKSGKLNKMKIEQLAAGASRP